MSDEANKPDARRVLSLAPDQRAPTAPDQRAPLARRDFFKVAGVAFAALSSACTGRSLFVSAPDAGVDGAADASAPDVNRPDVNVTGLPTLGGAPNTHEGQTVAALCDTVVPGRHRDPMGKPGAIDTDTPGMFFDPLLPAAPLVPLLVVLLDGASRRANGGRLFVALTPDEREATLITAIGDVPELEFGIQLVKLGFYSSDPVRDYLGYPGANTGYLHDPDFTMGRAMSTERTVDGNLR